MDIRRDDLNCGIAHIWGLTGMREGTAVSLNYKMTCLKRVLGFDRRAILTFSDGIHIGNGEALAKLIEDNNLGKLWKTDPMPNPQHRGETAVVLWCWNPDYTAIHKFVTDNTPKPPEPKAVQVSKAVFTGVDYDVKPAPQVIAAQDLPKRETFILRDGIKF